MGVEVFGDVEFDFVGDCCDCVWVVVGDDVDVDILVGEVF